MSASLIKLRERVFSKAQSIVDFLKITNEKKAASMRMEKLAAIELEFEKIQTKIVEFSCSAKPEESIVVEAVDAAFSDLIFMSQDLFSSICATSEHPGTPESSEMPIQTSIPKLKIPCFNGQISEWQSFIELFNSSIHHTALPEVIKFQHLRSLVKEEALHIIENFPLTSANYQLAYSALVKRFQNKRLLASFHLNRILSYKTVPLYNKESLVDFITAHKDSVDAFNNLNIEDKSDFILFQITYSHLDKSLQQSFDSKHDPTDIPTFRELIEHVEASLKYKELHMTQIQPYQPTRRVQPKQGRSFFASVKSSTKNSGKGSCSYCQSRHFISSCPNYLQKGAIERQDFVSKNGLCRNCLGSHNLAQCYSQKRCLICGERHHTSIHEALKRETSPTAISTHTIGNKTTTVLLATAIVNIVAPNGQVVQARALLDQGSEISLITEEISQLLKLNRKRAQLHLQGVGSNRAGTTNGVVSLKISPHFTSKFNFCCNAYIVPKLTSELPSSSADSKILENFRHITLADPHFLQSRKIDLLLGADVYGFLLQPGLRKEGTLTAQQTKIGWILSGSVQNQSPRISTMSTFHCCVDHDLHNLLRTFWEQETVQENEKPIPTPEEAECESHFIQTHRRDLKGRYIVKLPFKKSPTELGDSRPSALSALSRVQRKFSSNRNFQNLYSEFLKEYEGLGHMIPSSEHHHQMKGYYLPHHGVLRESSSTTKLRVVFNGSAKTSSGVSLNEILHVGPKLQNQISDVLQWWRCFQYVFSTDIEKMFRQISIAPEDQTYQRIIWSPEPSMKPQEYLLTTVTYGLTSAPYLANRVLKQLAEDEGSRFPLAVPVIHQGTYVDDIFGGANTLEDANAIALQVQGLCTAGGFKLHKWISNNPLILEKVSSQNNTSNVSIYKDDSTPIRTLGIIWEPTTDTFTFKSPTILKNPPYTKRLVLQAIAKLFDPLGWISPVIIKAKILLQEIWLAKLDWDETLPKALSVSWDEFLNQLNYVSCIHVPRWIPSSDSSVEIHGFADASEAAVAAVLYLRITQGDQNKIILLQSKTRVAPLKKLTIPRLELSAAVLLTQQTAHTIKLLKLEKVPIHFWTDSAVTLTWIQGHPSKWKEFVSNRVRQIQELLPSSQWHHIPGKQNPADCASRGLYPQELKTHQLWWNGPAWLSLPKEAWPIQRSSAEDTEFNNIDMEERNRTVTLTVRSNSKPIWDLVSKYSKLIKLLRVTALCRRFVTKVTPKATPLSSAELHHERLFWIRQTQHSYFAPQLEILSQNKQLAKSDPLFKLNPYVDESGLIRVGGRLRNSLLHPDQKHPLVLPKNSELTSLIIREAHERTLHGGTQLTLAFIRQSCWILGGRISIKSAILHCVRCARYRASKPKQLMGQLPAVRSISARPFLHSGVDYAGPVSIKSWKGRGGKIYKGYIVLFVCLSTSALHLDLVTDYSVEGFLAAYRRFTSRRGICASLLSDCGTNLTGANKELRKLFSKTSKELEKLSSLLANDGTEWKFNPPSAPHFGGKWEAGVKSVKHHLRRVIGDTPMTYEEFATLLYQIEAVLNSRPICPISDDPEDLEALTPAHFLIGSPLAAIPEPSLENLSMSNLKRWQFIQKLFQSFWNRWRQEYLQRFLSLSKWTTQEENLKPGTLVLLTDERYPPSKWPLVRITEVHPGADGLVRVVSVKTKTSTLKRPIVKLCPLPVSA